MKMTFKEALEHAIHTTGRAKSWRAVATRADVSYDILKNIKQGKSEKPNAEAAAKIADFFGASLPDFYAGLVFPDDSEEAAALTADTVKITDVVRRLQDQKHRDQVEAFARALLQTEEAQKLSE